MDENGHGRRGRQTKESMAFDVTMTMTIHQLDDDEDADDADDGYPEITTVKMPSNDDGHEGRQTGFQIGHQ